MSLAQLLAEQRRLAVLQALKADTDHACNERVLRQWVAAHVDDVPRDHLRADLLWLEQAGLLRIERLPAGDAGELWRAVLREDGLAVARGRHYPGVAVPDLG